MKLYRMEERKGVCHVYTDIKGNTFRLKANQKVELKENEISEDYKLAEQCGDVLIIYIGTEEENTVPEIPQTVSKKKNKQGGKKK